MYKVHICIADGKTAETTKRYSNSLSWPWGRVIRLIRYLQYYLTRLITIRQAFNGKTAIAAITTGDSDQATGLSLSYRIRQMHRERILRFLQSTTPRIPRYVAITLEPARWASKL